MDLVARGAGGTLDSMVACKLLWSGALSFGPHEVTWDGERNRIVAPTINEDVISLYSLTREEIVAVTTDLLRLLDVLEEDEDLRVFDEHVTDDVREMLPCGHLTGGTLFLLQQGTHPLIIEPAGTNTVRVRHNEALANGIPDLRRVICRLVCHLRFSCGHEGPVSVVFVDDAPHPHEHTVRMENTLEVKPLYDLARAAEEAKSGIEGERRRLLRVAGSLESSIYVTQALREATNEQLQYLEERREQVEQAQPDTKLHKSSALPTATTGTAKASRSLVLRSILYLGIGVGLLLLGRKLVLDGAEVAAWINSCLYEVVAIASDYLSLTVGITIQADASNMLGIPSDTIVSVLRIVGFGLVALGIVYPVRKILRRNRKLKRDIAYAQSHLSFISQLSEKQRLAAEAALAQDLDTWSKKLVSINDGIEIAHTCARRLHKTEDEAAMALACCYSNIDFLPQNMRALVPVCTITDYLDTGRCASLVGEDGAIEQYRRDLAAAIIDLDPNQATDLQPTLRTTARATSTALRRFETASSHERRLSVVDDHCNTVASIVHNT